MPLTLKTYLEEPIGAGARRIRLPAADYTTLCNYMQSQNKVVFLLLRSNLSTEKVMALRCEDGWVHVQRGVEGRQQDWLAMTPVMAVDEADAGGMAVPPCDVCSPPNPWDAAVVGTGLELDRTDPSSPVLKIADTGVAAGNYGGALVNAQGQFTYIPPGWPASALPTFDPCACGSGGGGGNSTVPAGNVTYSPCGFTGATNVQDALCYLENWAAGFTVNTGVLSINEGAGIDISGSSTSPTIALEPVGITPGGYGPYGTMQVNQFGQVTAFTPQDLPHPDVAAATPLHVSFDPAVPPEGRWTFTIDQASYTQWGTVRFVSVADIVNDAVPPAEEDWGVTYKGADALVDRKLSGYSPPPFDISQLPGATSPAPQTTDLMVIYNNVTNRHEHIDIADLLDLLPASPLKAMVAYDPGTDTISGAAGVTAVTKVTDGVFRVDLAAAVTDPVLSVSVRGHHPEAIVTAEQSSGTAIIVHTYELNYDNALPGLTRDATDFPFNLLVFAAA